MEDTPAPPETLISRLKIIMLAMIAFAVAYHVRDLVAGTAQPLWWLHLLILVTLAMLTWIENAWALFGFVLYIVAYKYLWVLGAPDREEAKAVVVLGIALACGAKYLYERRKKRNGAV